MLIAAAALSTGLGFSPALAQIDLSRGQRAADGTVYQVIAVNSAPLSSGVDQVRITTVAGSISGLASCSSSGAAPMEQSTAVGGADLMVPHVLHPFAAVLRSGVLAPNTLSTFTFDATNGGRLTVGTGLGAISICRDPADCIGAPNPTATYALSEAGGNVPAGCQAVTSTPCAMGAVVQSFAFGLPASGDPPTCLSPPTTVTRVCDPAPADGFTLGRGQFIVFMYNHSLETSGFSNATGGFGIDADGDSMCDSNQVVTADAQAPSAPPPIVIPPSPSPTLTPTISATPTPSATSTATATATPIPEICTDGIDNDGDGFVDCDDTADCGCEPILRDPAHLCPTRNGLYRYTMHSRVYADAEIASIVTKGISIQLMYHGGEPWARFEIPASALRITRAGARGMRYKFVDHSPGPGLKMWVVRKTWTYGQLVYRINGRAVVPAPLPDRMDIVQQITLGDRPFVSAQQWHHKQRCLLLKDTVLPP